MTTAISNLEIYNARMGGRAMYDKLFAVPHLSEDEVNIFVDFGCADGRLIAAMELFYPNTIFIGFDNDPRMVEDAKKNCKTQRFYTKWTDVEDALSHYPLHKKAIILSSVIHEVYSYMSYMDVESFWENVFKFDFVIVRDMMPSVSMSRAVNMDQYVSVRHRFPEQLASFEKINGKIADNRQLVHFLLKYNYKENWAREVRENYFSLTTEEMLDKIPQEFAVDYFEHFTPPFIKKTVERDTGILLVDNTHVKFILRKRIATNAFARI